jgi:hydrogenase-4 membrane subunit HyfE
VNLPEVGSLTATGLPLAASAAIFLLVVGIGVSRRPSLTVRLYAWIAVPQAALLVALALRSGAPLLWVDAAVTLWLKGGWVPRVLGRRLVRDEPDFGLAAAVSPAVLLLGAAAAAALGLRVGVLLAPGTGLALGILLAGMLLGFGTPCVRAELWSQTAGILAGEGALAASLLVLVGGLPSLAEGLALGEVLGLAAVLSGVVRWVHRLHGAPDARLLERLRG